MLKLYRNTEGALKLLKVHCSYGLKGKTSRKFSNKCRMQKVKGLKKKKTGNKVRNLL